MSATMQRLRVVVDVDDSLAGGWTDDLRVRLARGLEALPVKGGVQVRGVPGRYLCPPIYPDCWTAVDDLHRVADSQDAADELAGGRSTATGAWLSDRATFLRLAAQALYQHRHRLWLTAEAA